MFTLSSCNLLHPLHNVTIYGMKRIVFDAPLHPLVADHSYRPLMNRNAEQVQVGFRDSRTSGSGRHQNDGGEAGVVDRLDTN